MVSLDERARKELLLAAAAQVMWVNPVDEAGRIVYWLNKGAEVVEERKLGRTYRKLWSVGRQ